MPREIIEEVEAGRRANDLLRDWVRNNENRNTLLFEENSNPDLVQRVIEVGYADDLTDSELQQLGRDPFLIAYALGGPDRCVVTIEVSKPSARRQNRRIPDVCETLSIPCCNTFALTRKLGFSTSWNL